MKRGIFFLSVILLIIISISSINALIISEIESNPSGKDSKNEWIELFSPTEINDIYTLINNDGDELKIKLNFQGYHIYIFNTQWLDNSDEKVYLYDSSNKLIDQTNLFDDGEDSENTWQRCNNTWVFKKNTLKEKNNCHDKNIDSKDKQEFSLEKEIKNIQDTEDGKETDSEVSSEKEPEEDEKERIKVYINNNEKTNETKENTNSITAGVIKLDAKDIKSEGNKEEIDKNKLATIGLAIIAFVLFILLISQRYRYARKNEFR